MHSPFATFRGKRVLVTGHTGFTGSWASLWLRSLGAEVIGIGLEPETTPNLYEAAQIAAVADSHIVDICNYAALLDVFKSSKPDLVLHLAAQPLVRRSYREPRETFEVNVQGTANVLESCRNTESVTAVLCITTDKVYKNMEWDRGYREDDELGGRDPYSASKSAAEIVIASYRESFRDTTRGLAIGVARGGNIIGGGDWSEDRLIPDFIRASQSGEPMNIRYPDSTRPWQHVIALVEGYLHLLAGLASENSRQFQRAFNLGPLDNQEFRVREVLTLLSEEFPEVQLNFGTETTLHEAGKLALDSTLASETFGWRPTWTTEEVVAKTADWYKRYFSGTTSARELCLEQIDSWTSNRKLSGDEA